MPGGHSNSIGDGHKHLARIAENVADLNSNYAKHNRIAEPLVVAAATWARARAGPIGVAIDSPHSSQFRHQSPPMSYARRLHESDDESARKFT